MSYLYLFFVVREHRDLGVYVDKLTKHIVTDVNEVLGLIEKGKKNRWVGVQIDFLMHTTGADMDKYCLDQSQDELMTDWLSGCSFDWLVLVFLTGQYVPGLPILFPAVHIQFLQYGLPR